MDLNSAESSIRSLSLNNSDDVTTTENLTQKKSLPSVIPPNGYLFSPNLNSSPKGVIGLMDSFRYYKSILML